MKKGQELYKQHERLLDERFKDVPEMVKNWVMMGLKSEFGMFEPENEETT